MSATTRTEGDTRAPGILDPEHRLITIGMFALVFITAFEAMAVTAVMPAISAALDGDRLYALAFAGPLGLGVVGMVVAGNWADRDGPARPLIVSIALFVAGVLIAGLAPSMEVLVAGRLVHGLGGGALTVGLYVLVARRYDGALHPAIFGSFAAAWVVPSLVGPVIAGLIAQTVGWRWVFIGVVLLVIPAALMVRPALSGTSSVGTRPWRLGPILWAVLLAAGVLALNLTAQLTGPALILLAMPAAIAIVVALRPLLPVGALRLARGLPSIIVVKGLLAGAFLASEVYLPYLFTRQYGLTPALAGASLTVGGIAWAAASIAQGRIGERMPHVAGIRIGTWLLAAGIAVPLVTTLFGLPVWVPVIGWAFAGAGMGAAYPRISTSALGMTDLESQGFTSSALAITESTGAAIALAGTAVVFAALGPLGGLVPFSGTFGLTLGVALIAMVVGLGVTARR